jgi:hypothetical protein
MAPVSEMPRAMATAPTPGPEADPARSRQSGRPGRDPRGRQIVRTGTLQLTVTDVTAALTTPGRDPDLGGYIGGSQQERDGDTVVASVTYRIPVSRWEDAMDAIRGLGTEVGEKTDAVEVTGQIVDLDARIRNLKASETALVKYAAQAPKVTDLLEIQSRLTDTGARSSS